MDNIVGSYEAMFFAGEENERLPEWRVLCCTKVEITESGRTQKYYRTVKTYYGQNPVAAELAHELTNILNEERRYFQGN